MNGDVRPEVNKILNAIEQGNLPKDEMIRRIETLIQTEAEKSDAEIDLTLISACEDLLEELNLHETAPTDDRLFANQQGVQARIQRTKLRRKAAKAGLRVVAAAAALMVLLVAIDVIFDRGWFVEHSTQDEQQYVVQGECADPGLIEEGTARDPAADSELVTTSYEELVAFLGYEPILPNWMPETMQLIDYRSSKHSDEEFIVVTYSNNASDSFVQYTQICYHHLENARVSFEQSAEGEIITFNSVAVYKANNLHRNLFHWTIGNSVFSLNSNLADEENFKIIHSITGEENHV